MKMITRMLLSPAFDVTHAKSETNPKKMATSSSVYKTQIDSKVSEDEFDHLLTECIEQTLSDLLGTKVREALLDYLTRHNRLTRADILGHPRELSMLLEQTFGKGGITIGRCIMRKLYASLDWEYKETSNSNFFNQVEEARAYWKMVQDVKHSD